MDKIKRNYTFKLNKPAFEINKKVLWIKLRIFCVLCIHVSWFINLCKKFPCKKQNVQSLMSNDIVSKRKYLYGLLMKLDIELKWNQHQHISPGFLVHLKNLSFNCPRWSPTTRYTFQLTVFFRWWIQEILYTLDFMQRIISDCSWTGKILNKDKNCIKTA